MLVLSTFLLWFRWLSIRSHMHSLPWLVLFQQRAQLLPLLLRFLQFFFVEGSVFFEFVHLLMQHPNMLP